MKIPKPISNKKLTNALARLYRRITDDELEINTAMWRSYFDDYLRKLYPDDLSDMNKVKVSRTTALGNLTDAIRKKGNLSYKKFLTGLCLIKATKMKITLDIDFKNGKHVVVSEEIFFNDNLEDENDEDED